VAYYGEVVAALRTSGIASFEIVPWSLPEFRALPVEQRLAWNASFFSAEAQPRARVIAVAARIHVEGYTLPDPSIVATVSLSHGPEASFLMDTGGNLASFHFTPDAPRSACGVIAALAGTDLGCDGIAFFEARTESPFAEMVSTYASLNSITTTDFEGASMFGTSLRGIWTIDLRGLLSQLALHGPEAVSSFWNAFRGLEFKVFWVPLD
jgi:hypothetical protein